MIILLRSGESPQLYRVEEKKCEGRARKGYVTLSARSFNEGDWGHKLYMQRVRERPGLHEMHRLLPTHMWVH